MFKYNDEIFNMNQEDLAPVIEVARTRDEDQTRQTLIDCVKDKFTKEHLAIYEVKFEDHTCECEIWDELRHDYILELAFDI